MESNIHNKGKNNVQASGLHFKRTGREKKIDRVVWAMTASVLFLFLPATLCAQMATPMAVGETSRLSASVSSAYQFKSNMDGGGDVSIAHYGVGIGGGIPLGERAVLGMHMNYAVEDYHFSDANVFPVQKPWGQINRVGFSMLLGGRLTEKWSIGAGPVIQYAGENGAKFGDSLNYGGIVSAVYRPTQDVTIGFGAGVFYRLHETRFFPSLIASWNITDRLRLGNSSRLGVTGPAGVELSYKMDDNWDTAVGGGYQSSRFRLDENGSTPNGIGENSSWPVYARLGRKLGKVFLLDLYGGLAFKGNMKLQDSSGNDIRSIDYNTAPIVGFNLRASFF
jgi:hypothetical protein